jgi:hypothetical protein
MEDQANQQLDRLKDAVGAVPGDLLKYVLIAVGGLALLYIAHRVLKRLRRKPPLPEPDLTIDVESLGTAGPPTGGPLLEHYNVPMRLAAVVLAPVGRVRQLPPPDELDVVFDAVVPGLAQVVRSHGPSLYRWPQQLSSTGFAHSFFRNASLPGDGGKGTPWCAAAGVVKVEGQPVMVGIVMRSELPNSLAQTVVERETNWLDLLRVKPSR